MKYRFILLTLFVVFLFVGASVFARSTIPANSSSCRSVNTTHASLDVCKTPPAISAPVPIPYTNSASASMSKQLKLK
jgi:hypothetical protein